jgi:hypothetical protein
MAGDGSGRGGDVSRTGPRDVEVNAQDPKKKEQPQSLKVSELVVVDPKGVERADRRRSGRRGV